MSDTTDPGGGNPLYDLLPAIFHQADADQSFPLLALTQVLYGVDQALREGIAALEDVWFVETCPIDTLLQIAPLLGITLPLPLRPEHRALVADALAVRRRKGTAAALPILLRGASNWYALVLEPDGTVPAAAWPLGTVPSGFVPPLRRARRRLWVWRLPVYGVEAIPAPPLRPTNEIPATWYKWYRRYWMNPLGLPQPVWNVASTALPAGPAPVTALPLPVTRDLLQTDLDRYRQDWPVTIPGTPANSLFYGPDRGFAFTWQTDDKSWHDVPPGQVRVMTLGAGEFPPPDYPVFRSGPIDTTQVDKVSEPTIPLRVTMGSNTIASLAIARPAPPATIAQLADALQKAFKNAQITAQGAVSADDLMATQVMPIGTRLAVIPGNGTLTDFRFSNLPPPPPPPDVLALIGSSAGEALAVRTVAIDDPLANRLFDPTAGGALYFTDGANQKHGMQLPLNSSTYTYTVGGPAPTIDDVVEGLRTALQSTAAVLATPKKQVIIISSPDYNGSALAQAVNSPVMGRLAWDLGLERAVVADPETGSLIWPASWPPTTTVVTSSGHAAPAAIGCGYERTLPQTDPDAVQYQVDETIGFERLDAIFHRWDAAAPASAVLTLVGSESFKPQMNITSQPALFLALGQTLLIQAQQRRIPVILPLSGTSPPLPLIMGGKPGSQNLGQLQLDGLLVQGALGIANGPNGAVGGGLAVTLSSTTVFAGQDEWSLAQIIVDPKHVAQHAALRLDVTVDRSIMGAMDFTDMHGNLTITDSIISRLPLPEFAKEVIQTDGTNAVMTTMQRSTVLGWVSLTGDLTATDTLFVGKLDVSGTIALDHCYVAYLHWVPVGNDRTAGGSEETEPATVTRCSACGRCGFGTVMSGP
jgi:hypothetical protein